MTGRADAAQQEIIQQFSELMKEVQALSQQEETLQEHLGQFEDDAREHTFELQRKRKKEKKEKKERKKEERKKEERKSR